MMIQVDSQKENWLEAITAASASAEAVTIEFAENDVIDGSLGLAVLKSHEKVIIKGNGAILRGNGTGTALILTGKQIVVEGLKVEGFFTGIVIQAGECNVENVRISNCEFRDIVSEAIASGIVESEREINGIEIADCIFEAPARERGGHCSCATNLMTAVYNSADQPIHDVALRNVKWMRNHLTANPVDGNLFSLGFTAHGACNHAFYENGEMERSSYNEVSHSTEENFWITDNVIDGVYDIGITALAALPGKRDCMMQNVVIAGNRITYNNTAINVGATNIPCNGEVEHCVTRNVRIENNTVIPREPGPFEPQIGIMLFTVRAESLCIRCTDCHLENVVVSGNHVMGREVGVALQAIHATQDLPYPSYLADCSLRDVTIVDNKIFEAQRPIRIFASHLEGRYDDFWGYKLVEYDQKLPYSTLCERGVIDGVIVKNNEIKEYDCAFTLGAAWACGHAFVKGSILGPDFLFAGNKLDGGRKVFCYKKYITDNILYEDAVGVENYVIGKYEVE